MRDGASGDGAELGNRDLEIRQQLEQERLELVIGAIDLVDQQHWRGFTADGGEQRPLEEIFFREDLVLNRIGIRAMMRLDRQQLPLVIPFVQRGGLVQPLIALQADQLGPMHAGERLGDLGLANPRLTFQQQRALEHLHERDRGRKLGVGDVAARCKGLRDLVTGFHVLPNAPSFRGGPKDRTRNLEILRCAIAHHSSVLRTAPE